MSAEPKHSAEDTWLPHVPRYQPHSNCTLQTAPCTAARVRLGRISPGHADSCMVRGGLPGLFYVLCAVTVHCTAGAGGGAQAKP